LINAYECWQVTRREIRVVVDITGDGDEVPEHMDGVGDDEEVSSK